MSQASSTLLLAAPSLTTYTALFILSIIVVVVGLVIKKRCHRKDAQDQGKVSEERGLIIRPGLRSVLTASRSRKSKPKGKRVGFDDNFEEVVRNLPPEPDDEANDADDFEDRPTNREI